MREKGRVRERERKREREREAGEIFSTGRRMIVSVVELSSDSRR